MKKLLMLFSSIMLVLTLSGCGCTPDGPGEIPEPNPGEGGSGNEKFDYTEVMFDNPSDWPTDTFFINVPAVAASVDDLTHVMHGDNAEKEVYTLTIKKMDYATFKAYTDQLVAAGFSCSRAGYWLPDKEKDLSNNYSQCVANSNGVYIKANWYKSSVNFANFQMTITNYDIDAK